MQHIDPSCFFSLLAGLLTALLVIGLFTVHKRKRRRWVPGVPSVDSKDPLYKKLLKYRHHGMVDIHGKLGDLVQVESLGGSGPPMLYFRGSGKELERFFNQTKVFTKNAGTFDHLGGAVDVINLVQPMLVDTLFEWEGKKWASSRKVVNPFFVHPDVYSSTINAVNDFFDAKCRNGEEGYEGDLLSEVHTMIKVCVVEIMGGYRMDDEDTKVLDEVIEYFVDRNLDDSSFMAPTLNMEDATVFKKISCFGHKVVKVSELKRNELK